MKNLLLVVILFTMPISAKTIRVASFNVSMEAGNYIGLDGSPSGDELFALLAEGKHQQIQNIAEIIQRVRPDIILLNEFDFISDPEKGVNAFSQKFLQIGQNGAKPINFPYYFVAPVNTGVDSPIALNHSRQSGAPGNNSFGFGLYPGQYGMLVLSRYPIDSHKVRTFQTFLWKDMPGSKLSEIKDEQGNPWYTKQAQEALRLSSKSHWDIPVQLGDERLHILASHPTPPVFDGPENRNGARNHDEIRFWLDYIGDPAVADYIYDDQRKKGGFNGERFVLLGDLNASPVEGDANKQAITQLLENEKVSDFPLPTSKGGKQHSPESQFAANHTAAWGMMVDYALPSESGLKVEQNGIFWPQLEEDLHHLVKDRTASSDHRLVWVDVRLVDASKD